MAVDGRRNDAQESLPTTRSQTKQVRPYQRAGDPTLIVGYWSASDLGFVDDAGRPVDATDRRERAVTRIVDHGEPNGRPDLRQCPGR